MLKCLGNRNICVIVYFSFVTVAYRYGCSPLNSSDVNGRGFRVPPMTKGKWLSLSGRFTGCAGLGHTDTSNAIKQKQRYDE